MADEIKLSGILEKGYGISPKLVMTDINLSIEAKGIYAYLSSFCGNGITSFPSVELIQYHLRMGKKRFYKYRNELIERGYIKVTRRHDGNKALSNVYTLCGQIEPIQIEPIQIEPIQNDYTNNNNLNNNSFYKNNNNTYSDLSNNELFSHPSLNTKNTREKKLTQTKQKHKYGEYNNVLLSDDELRKLKEEFSNDWEERIERVSEYCASKGKSYKDYLATIRSWARKETKISLPNVEEETINKPQKSGYERRES